MSRIRNTTHKVYNFHKDNGRDIVKALFQNFAYSFGAGVVPSAIVVGHPIGVGIAFLYFYGMFTLLINRPRYETTYGKILMWLTCAAGGFAGWYSVAYHDLITKLLNLL